LAAVVEIERVRKKFVALKSTFSERTRRLWAGAEADALGRGGVAWVAAATGIAISTVRKGRDEVRRGVHELSGRDRVPGGGRRRLEKKDPGIVAALEALVSPAARGDPQSALRWTCKSVRVLSRELTKAAHPVGPSKVGELLRAAGYSLQATTKTKEGKSSHPDRDAQFAFINERANDFISRGLPVISVDAKKKELIGEHENGGREWQPKGKAVEVLTHGFFEAAGTPKAIPYGIYDLAENSGFINVGTDNNTPTFAVRSIEKWWAQAGSPKYPVATQLFITADAGGSNGIKSHVWKTELQRMADKTGLTIHVSHFPPGTSKWNKIEHRLFSFVSINWRGRPLVTYETVVALIAATTTSTGLAVKAELDADKYPLGVTVSRRALAALQLERAAFHGDWNYTLSPRTAAQLAAAEAAPAPERTPVSHSERKAQWTKLIRQQLLSGLSNRRFCRENHISYEGFIQARRRIVGKIRKYDRRPK
jgi:Rhodopirellula transposase DDE domain